MPFSQFKRNKIKVEHSVSYLIAFSPIPCTWNLVCNVNICKIFAENVLSVFFVVINITAAAFRVNIFVSYVRYLYVLIKKVVLVYCNMYWL